MVDVGVLGATGLVGQKIIALLERAPGLRVVEVSASEARIGERFGDTCRWREPLSALPRSVSKLRISALDQLEAPYVISCLPSSVAVEAEPLLARRGRHVFSNASAHRMNPQVPLLIPEVNLAHLSLLGQQTTEGKIVTNPNCATVGVALAVAPLVSIAPLRHLSVVTLQSISGAGYPGLAAYDMLNNTIPHIEEEAEKLKEETKKILGTSTEAASFALTAHVHRVPTQFGHTVTLHLSFEEEVTLEDAKQAYRSYAQRHPGLFVLHQECDRPQAALDLLHDDMRVHIGQLRRGDTPHMIGLVAVIHNLVRGAAGAAIANLKSFLGYVSVSGT